MIELEKVDKSFGSFHAVKELSLRVPDGELYGFLGPNGAGKTTTVKMIVGLMRPSRGRVLVDGRDVVEEPEAVKRRTGYIPDTPYVYPQLTVGEYLDFVEGVYELDPEPARRIRARYTERFRLDEWHQDLVENLSHGMKQKMLFTGVFMLRPSVIVIDEPMVGLDPESARVMKESLRREVEARNTSVFLSTHSLEVAQEICDRVGILSGGRLLAEGSYGTLRRSREESLEDVFLRITSETTRAAPDR